MKYLVIIILLILPSITHACNQWTKQNTGLETAYQITHFLDYLQTSEIVRNDKYYELNPVLGKYPSQVSVNEWFATMSVAHYSISCYLPANYRKSWQGITLLMQGLLVFSNASKGLIFQINFWQGFSLGKYYEVILNYFDFLLSNTIIVWIIRITVCK